MNKETITLKEQIRLVAKQIASSENEVMDHDILEMLSKCNSYLKQRCDFTNAIPVLDGWRIDPRIQCFKT